MTKNEFLESIKDLVIEDMIENDILASLTAAQAILESGWGLSGLAVKGKALFGIKATPLWTGKVYVGDTQESYDGIGMVETSAVFRAYDSWKDSITDHSALLTGLHRYKNVIGEIDYRAASMAVHAAGYATDPNYAYKLINLIESYKLYEYDMEAKEYMRKIEELEKRIEAVEYAEEPVYNTVDEVPQWARQHVQRWVDEKIVVGDNTGLNLPLTAIRILIMTERIIGQMK